VLATLKLGIFCFPFCYLGTEIRIRTPFFTVPTNAHRVHFKTLKCHIKHLTLAPKCFSLLWNHPHGARKLHFASLLRWDLLIYIRYKIVHFVAICWFILSIHVEWIDIQPQTAGFYNKCESTDPILVTQRSAVYEPPENGFKGDLKSVGLMLSI
jgi:hypothetical protein